MCAEKRLDGLVGVVVVVVRLAILASFSFSGFGCEEFEFARFSLVSGSFETLFPPGGLAFRGRDDFALFVHQECVAGEATGRLVRGSVPDLGTGTDELGVLGSLDMIEAIGFAVRTIHHLFSSIYRRYTRKKCLRKQA